MSPRMVMTMLTRTGPDAKGQRIRVTWGENPDGADGRSKKCKDRPGIEERARLGGSKDKPNVFGMLAGPSSWSSNQSIEKVMPSFTVGTKDGSALSYMLYLVLFI